MADAHYKVIIIGAGVIGLAVALEITRRFPRQRLLVLEKEDRVAAHQSGHNSGVIHSGVYYKPGSLKASLCVTGAAAMVEFCRENDIPHKVCGKVIVATDEEELPGLEELREDGESLKVSSETVGHVLKYLGLYSRRLGNAGRGLVFDKATQSQAHRLGEAYDVLTSEPSCEYCHEVQQPQAEELVKDV